MKWAWPRIRFASAGVSIRTSSREGVTIVEASASDQISARNRQRGSGDVARLLCQEEKRGPGDLVRSPKTAGRNLPRERGRPPYRDPCAHDPRENHVHGDAVRRLLVSHAPREREERRLGGAIGVRAR